MMSKNAVRTAFGAVLLSFFALPAAAGSGSSDVRKPVLLVDVPQLAQCRGLLTQALLDRVINATEDPGQTFEKMRRARRSMIEAPPWIECESKLWKSLNRHTGLFNVTPQSSGPLGLQSPDPAAEAMVRSLAASVGNNIDPDGGVADYQGEMQIAVNQNNPQQLVAAANTFYQDPSANCLSPTGGYSGTDGTQALYGSNDGGSTWTYKCAPWPPSLTGPPGASFFFGSDPAVAWDNQGRAYAAYMLLAYGADFSTAIVVARSADAGQTWSPLGIVVNNLASGALFDDKEMMAVDNSAGPPSATSHPGRLYVVWDQNNIERIAHSDDGVTWTPVVLPPTGFGSYDIGSDVKVGADGTVYVIWNRLLYSGGQTGEKMVFSKSVDGGNTWSAPVVVVSTALLSFGSNSNPPAQDYRGVNAFGSLDVDRNPASPFFGTLYVAYCDFPTGTTFGTDLNSYVVRSTDGGATWSAPVKTSDDGGTASQFFPWLSVDQSDGTVNVSWYDTRLDPNNRKTQIFYARSSNGAVSFEPNLLVTDSGAVGWRNAVNYSDENYYYDNYGGNANQYGDYGGCVAANRQVHPFWADSRQFFPNADTVVPTRLEDAATATIVNCSAPAQPPAPAATTTCAPSPRVHLSWNSASSWGTNATNGTYAVYRSVTATFPGGTPLASNLTGTSFDDAAGLPGTTYYYFVTATNNCPGTILTPMTAVSAASAATVFPPCGATLGTLSGHVTVNGIPIAGASLGAGVYSATTDATGAYSIVIVTGTFTVTAGAAGYDPASQSNVVVISNATTTADFALSPATTAACFTDSTQADFQAGSGMTNVDLTAAPGSVKLATSAPAVYQTSGSLVSSLKDSGAVVPGGAMTWTTLSWSATTPAGTSVKFQIAASNAAAGPFTFVGPDGTATTFFTTNGASLAQFNRRRYLKYTAFLATTDTSVTPGLDSVTLCDQIGACTGTTLPVITPSATDVCPYAAGNTATATAGSLAYAWSIVNGTITAGANAQTVTFTAGPSGTTTLTLVTTASSGCTAGSSAGITINTTTPSPSISAGGPTTFCPGNSVLLTSSSATANQWYLDGVAIAGAVNSTYNAMAAGNYTVTFTQGGCGSFPSVPLTVTYSPQNAAPIVSVLGPVTFCAGASVKLTSSASTDNQWFLDGAPIAGATGTSYVVTASGSYTVSSTPPGGCAGLLSSPVVVTVNPHPATPAITAGGPTTFCYPGTVTLTSSSATGNQWYRDTYLIYGATGSSYIASSTGSYTVAVTSNGCSSTSAPVSVSVSYSSTPYIYTSGSTSFCIGGSVTLTSSVSTNIQWYKDGSPIANATNPTYVATTSGSYTAGTTVTGCISMSYPVTVTASTPPAAPTITANGSTTICSGNYVILTASSATNNQWYLNGSPTYSYSQTIYAYSPGVYTVTTATNGCASAPSAPVTVTVLPQPVATSISAGGPTTFCSGGSVTLTAGSAAGYQWYLNNSAIAGATNQSFAATQTGYYFVDVVQNGCNSYTSNYISVNVTSGPPAPTITPGGSTALCDNATITLTSSSSSGNQWFLNGNAIPGATARTYVASAGGSYTLQYTTGGTCLSAMSAPLVLTTGTKPATPSLSAGGATTFCAGGSVTLTSTNSANNLWYRNGLLIADATASSYVATASGSYTVVATNSGCNSAPSAEITVTATPYPAHPVITPAGAVTYCSADPPLQLTTNNATGNQWYINGFAIANATGQAYIVTQPGLYTVGSINNGCDGGRSAPVTVTFATSPAPPTISAGGPTTFCPGGSVTISSSAATANQWLRNGTPIAGATGQTYAATTGGMYAVQVTGGSCAVTSLALSVTVTTGPSTPTIATAGPTTFCGTVSGVTLTSSNSSGNRWYLDTSPIYEATGNTYQPNQPGTYTVQTTLNGCLSPMSAPVVITSPGLTGVRPVIANYSGTGGCGSIPLSSNFTTGNQWYLNGAAITGATSQAYTATASGSYTLQVTQGSCSSLMSNPVSLTIQTPPAKPVLTATGSTTLCDGGSVTLHSSAADSTWFRDRVYYVTSGPTCVATQAGSYQVLVSGTPTCQSVYSDPLVVSMQATPVVTIATAGSVTTGTNGIATLTATGASTYQWTITNGAFIGSATGTSVNFTAGNIGTLTLKATASSSAGCAASKTVNLLVTPIPGQEKFDPNGDVTIDPADVFYLVNYLFANGPAPKGAGGPLASGDANGDGVVDPADVFYVVSYLFNSGPHPYSHLAGTSVAAAPQPLRGTLSLGRAVLRDDGKYTVPVIVSKTAGEVQALALRIHLEGGAASATVHRAGTAATLTPLFETSRESPGAASYVVSFGEGTHLDGIVAEVVIDAVTAGRVRLVLDPSVTMLSNSTGTLEATPGHGTLLLRGTTISIDRPARAKDSQ